MWFPYSIPIGQEGADQMIKACVLSLVVLFLTKINKLSF